MSATMETEASAAVRKRCGRGRQDRGAEVSPGGALGSVVAKLFGEEPDQQVSDDLRRFKQIVETGEIACSDGSPLGSRNRNQVDQHDGQPLDDDEVGAARQKVRP